MARRTNDFYETHRTAVEVLLAHLLIPATATVLEPCAGGNAIANVLRGRGLQVRTNDIDRSLPGHDTYFDARSDLVWGARSDLTGYQPPDFAVTNPPFSEAFRILMRAMDYTRDSVVMLLRLSFLEPTLERGPWLAKNPPRLTIVLPRYSFTGDGKTDSVTCAWMVWTPYQLQRPGPRDTQLVIVPRDVIDVTMFTVKEP